LYLFINCYTRNRMHSPTVCEVYQSPPWSAAHIKLQISSTNNHLRFSRLTAKSTVFMDVSLYSVVKSNIFMECILSWTAWGLVVRVPGYRSRGPGSIPGATRFSDKWWVWNGVHLLGRNSSGSGLENRD
jgi:hypothetical protein